MEYLQYYLHETLTNYCSAQDTVAFPQILYKSSRPTKESFRQGLYSLPTNIQVASRTTPLVFYVFCNEPWMLIKNRRALCQTFETNCMSSDVILVSIANLARRNGLLSFFEKQGFMLLLILSCNVSLFNIDGYVQKRIFFRSLLFVD